MNNVIPKSLKSLVNELSKLPSIGHKTAYRLACHIVTRDMSFAKSLANSLENAAISIKKCPRCFMLTDEDLCPICQSKERDTTKICIVEKSSDIFAIESNGSYSGIYHVIDGLISPLNGITPEKTNLPLLKERILSLNDSESPVSEVIIALSSTVEGDATSLYISRMLQGMGIEISKLAQGMPKGGELEYIDEVTLFYAFEGRTKLE